MHENHQDVGRVPQRLARRDFLKMAAAVGGSALALSQMRQDAHAGEALTTSRAASSVLAPQKHPVRPYSPDAQIEARTFDNLSTVEGLSESQLTQHLGLYKGYVARINEIERLIRESDPELAKVNITYAPFRELHVEQSFALNGVILHEYYFENLGGERLAATQTEMFHPLVVKQFGSWDNYVNHVMALGRGMRGWVMTGYNMRDGKIHNYGLDQHNQWVPVNVIPLMVLDVYEHAYMIDFGTRRPAYLDVFMQNVNWRVVDARLKTMMFHA